MKIAVITFVLFIFVSDMTSIGQRDVVPPPAPAPSIEKLFARLSSIREDSIRLRINDSINTIISSFAGSDSVFSYKFTNIRHLGQITSPDSKVKIVTWNLLLTKEKSRYFCYLIKKEAKGKEDKVYYLTTSYTDDPIKKNVDYNQNNWYGALYYDIRPFKYNGNACWILLGIDYGNPLVTRKIIDVLSFPEDGSLLFGMKWFKAGDQISNREVLEYSADGTMSLRFNSRNSIVFDHLVPINPLQKGDRKYYGSDYSFDAYVYEKDLWNLKINVDARNND
jgi:hypothetical protein